MTGRVQGKVAVITGAARGQGRNHAIRLAEEGADIIGIDLCGPVGTVEYPLPGEDDLAVTVKEVEARGQRMLGRVADVRDADALRTVVDEGAALFGRIDIVLGNAGIATYRPATEITDAHWREMIDINLTGAWNICSATMRHIIDGGRGGAIILTSSTAGLRAIPNAAHYVAAKHGLVGLMRTLALELAPHRIRVNTIHPTSVNTPMLQNEPTYALFLPGRVDPTSADFARVAQSLNALPVPWAEPDDVSGAILYLVSDDGRLVTGSTFTVDAGQQVRW